MKYISVLMTVHNRKEKTLSCLSHLFGQEISEGYTLEVYLTDDGCTDGTSEAICEQFPSVHIIQGDGTLYWNRGMYTAWNVAAKQKNYDFYLWLNDDTRLMDTCIKSLLESSEECQNKAVIVASIRSEKEKKITYGGHASNGHVVPNGHLQECCTMNGNCVLIPRSVYQECGNLDWTFRHAIGDLDYGYRARKAGFKIYASRTYLAYCEKQPHLPAWARPEIPFPKRIRNLYSPLGYAEPIPFFHYECRNFGLFTAIKHFITIHIRVLCPWLWKNH